MSFCLGIHFKSASFPRFVKNQQREKFLVFKACAYQLYRCADLNIFSYSSSLYSLALLAERKVLKDHQVLRPEYITCFFQGENRNVYWMYVSLPSFYHWSYFYWVGISQGYIHILFVVKSSFWSAKFLHLENIPLISLSSPCHFSVIANICLL